MRRMSKTTGNKVSIDKNLSFARFALSRKTISVSGQTMDSIRRYGKKKSRSGSLVILLSIGTNSNITFVILFFLHSNYPFFCVALETLLCIMTV